MKRIVNNWHNISVYIAGAIFVIVALFVTDSLQKVLLLSAAVLFLHFFEEFGWPGGFPFLGMKVMMRSDETDSTKWNCNNLSSMFGNWIAGTLLYILPAFFLNIKFLTLAAILLSVAELIMHLITFNVKERTLYNPGAITAIFGLTPIACYYFLNIYDASLYALHDYVFAFLWFAVIFWFCYRSPVYWNLGKKEGYPLTDQSAYGFYKPEK